MDLYEVGLELPSSAAGSIADGSKWAEIIDESSSQARFAPRQAGEAPGGTPQCRKAGELVKPLLLFLGDLVFELETTYLQESNHFGNVLKGYDGFLSSSKTTTNLKRSRKFQPEDRLFSLSSITSPAVEEQGGRDDLGTGRSRGGGIGVNGPGKPKKARLGPRDGRRIRLSSDPELEDEDDTDLGAR
ncbi:Chromatin modification-related protein [Drosera capensis]